MGASRWAPPLLLIASLVIAACSSTPREDGQVLVALTVAWEGAELDPAELEALTTLRREAGDAPLTHFVCPAYLTRPHPPTTSDTIGAALRDGDELAVHLHAWSSLAIASGVTFKPSPSFMTGTDKLLPTAPDLGYDTDLDAYTVPELRAMLRTARSLLTSVGFPISPTFRAAGYLATPKVRDALVAERFTIDSSAISATALHAASDDPLAARVSQLWPEVGSTTQPFVIHTPNGDLREVPISALLSATSADELAHALSVAYAEVESHPDRKVLFVVELDLETASEVVDRFGLALGKLPARQRTAMRPVTIEHGIALLDGGHPR